MMSRTGEGNLVIDDGWTLWRLRARTTEVAEIVTRGGSQRRVICRSGFEQLWNVTQLTGGNRREAFTLRSSEVD